jgi:hypothetical protein
LFAFFICTHKLGVQSDKEVFIQESLAFILKGITIFFASSQRAIKYRSILSLFLSFIFNFFINLVNFSAHNCIHTAGISSLYQIV